MNYKNIIVIGAGKISRLCLSSLLREERRKLFIKLTYIEYGNHFIGSMEEYCKKENIFYFRFQSKKLLKEYFLYENDETLVISAANYFIFPENIVSKSNFLIINYHDALLPSYPGRNAVTWAIFNNEKETGITWHKVNADIDTGDIIAQEKILLTEDMKAYELLQKSFNSAFCCFNNFIDNLLINNIKMIKQVFPENRRIYLSTDIPNDGKINLDMLGIDVYRLLRSIDYSGLKIFPSVRFTLNNEEKTIIKYSKVLNNIKCIENGILLKLNDEYNLLLIYE